MNIDLIFLAGKHLELDITVQNVYKKTSMEAFPGFFNQKIETTEFNFQQINLIGGIKWKF